ncbi:hypothetical protein Psuf_035410 [Phytohabitans suffuscus]|uniref:Uncharacterized protein n=1 Tax=Phytohabitans suffuscus TaxID=624315 RepID=A0A6F8YJU6_9ACTN|nr:hypothetical protein Psuf_035410 [Phytohabitans suffuscus]
MLLLTAVKVIRDALRGTAHEIDIDSMRAVRMLRRLMPVAPTTTAPS